MATDSSKGFKYEGRLSGQPDWVMPLLFKDTETLTPGDILNLESGEVDLAVTTDTALLGTPAGKKISGTDSTTTIEVHVAPDAMYSVYDPNARSVGDTLDLAGTTGQQTVAASTNKEFIVIGGTGADERTLVMINPKLHAFAKEVA